MFCSHSLILFLRFPIVHIEMFIFNSHLLYGTCHVPHTFSLARHVLDGITDIV